MAATTNRGPRWESEFGRWVAEYGVSAIVEALANDPQLRVTKHAVYEWLRGHAPHPDRARALVRLSRGRLTLEAIYQHVREERERLRRESEKREAAHR